MNNSDPQTKPPIGIEPEYIWKQKRAFALIEAIARYSTTGASVSNEWLAELAKLLPELFLDNAESIHPDKTP